MRRRVLFASGVAAAGLLVTSVLQPWGSAPVQASPALLDFQFASARSIADAPGQDVGVTFDRLSRAAAAQPAPSASSGTQYVVTDSWAVESDHEDGDGSALIPRIEERYVEADGSGRLVTRRGDPLESDGRGLPRDGDWRDEKITNDESLPADSLDPAAASALPTEPAALRAALSKQNGCQDYPTAQQSYCLFAGIVGISQESVLSPQLDAAIWQLLRSEKGYRDLGTVEDRAGREGVGISYTTAAYPEYRYVLIADPDTGGITGYEEILIQPVDGVDLDLPAVKVFNTILQSSYLD